MSKIKIFIIMTNKIFIKMLIELKTQGLQICQVNQFTILTFREIQEF